MSFQGDVRGIGLAELLQGLARGRKVGTLTLSSTKGFRATLGLEEGLAVLLPDEEEDPDIWRTRVTDAWAADPDFRVDYMRMSEIAKAVRLEELYSLLDGGGVHFRFDPGDLPDREGAADDPEDTPIFCEGVQVEFLLLEYARIGDEIESQPGAMDLPDDAIPYIVDAALAPDTPPRLFENCDGTSTLKEISDRLGWPLRRGRLQVFRAAQAGALALVPAAQFLRLAIDELGHKNYARAANRLSAWCRDGQPGPVDAEGAESLANEWVSGRLTAALKAMEPRRIRTLLRRLDHSLRNPSAAVVHWLEASRLNKTDRIMRMKRMIAEFREGSQPDRPGIRELLDLARDFRDAGHPMRSGPLLVVVAHLQPESVGQQLEVGTGLVAAGRPQEGSPWILNGCRVLLEGGDADRTVGPLRGLLQSDPRNRECRQLLSRARRESTHAKKLRKQLLIGLAIVSMFSMAAVAKIHRNRLYQEKLAEVRDWLHDPTNAMAMLNRNFPDDQSIEVHALRQDIEDRQRMDQVQLRDAWYDLYKDAQLECAKGDPLVALEKVSALPPHPRLSLVSAQWPLVHDLYATLTNHLNDEIEVLGPPAEGQPAQIQREDNIDKVVDMIRDLVPEDKLQDPAVLPFLEALNGLSARIDGRRDRRDQITEDRLHQENLQERERLYRLAQQHAANGDFERAENTYAEILSHDPDPGLRRVLAPMIAEVQAKNRAIKRARSLAHEGKHVQSWDLLQDTFENPYAFMMPWKVESFPSGVRVEYDRKIRTTPFEVESTFGEPKQMTFILDGFVRHELGIERPADIMVYMSRTPDRFWAGEGRVDAIPVSVGRDHIVVDRKGNIARIGPGGELGWNGDTKHIDTLSGIARAPVFMPKRAGALLMVTEDGEAWILGAEDGRLEGPKHLGSAPLVGPAPGLGEVRLRLSDGRVAVWTDALRPVVGPENGTTVGAGGDFRYGSTSGMQVLRRRSAQGTRLSCKWNDWVVEVEDEVYRVYRQNDESEGYTVVRDGDWEFVAWESATAKVPYGRLWISDGAGLRAYVP